MQVIVVGTLGNEVNEAINIVKKRNARVFFATNVDEAIDTIRNGKGTDLALVDVGFDIEKFTKALKAEHINTPTIAYGVNASPKEAVTAIKAGAKEFLPFPPDEKLIAATVEAIVHNDKACIYESEAMQEVIKIASKIAKSDANILITGDSGTGKEVLSHYVHNNSKRVNQPFVRVNCAAIPDNLIESELFGHEKGAFTGAIARRIGKFEEASGGTLMLDEISEMDIKLQAKLLRAIQEKEIDRVGGSAPIKINLRIIATSNRDLEKEIIKGTFREDLYFRLNVINIEIPSLKERIEDIEILSNHFVEKYCNNNNLESKILSAEALNKLKNHNWPGNIRELENVIHRAVLLADENTIHADDLMLKKQKTYFVGKKINEAEAELITNTMDHCIGDENAAANILGISIANLKAKLEKYASS